MATIQIQIDTSKPEDQGMVDRLAPAIRYLATGVCPLDVTVGFGPSGTPTAQAGLDQSEAEEAVDANPTSTTAPTRAEVVNDKKVLRRCSTNILELVAAAAAAYPPPAEFTLEELAVKIRTVPDITSLTSTLRAHPKAATDLVGAMVSWRRNLSRPEKRIGQVLLERVDSGESPARYRVAAGVPRALHELANPPSPRDRPTEERENNDGPAGEPAA
jgi:hypothetical protein